MTSAAPRFGIQRLIRFVVLGLIVQPSQTLLADFFVLLIVVVLVSFLLVLIFAFRFRLLSGGGLSSLSSSS